jgi:Na+/phosphate symporter
MFNFGMMKSARVADQIDAEVKAGVSLLQNAEIVSKQFDFIEQQLQQFASLIQSHDPHSAMQFTNMQQNIDNVQAQIRQSLAQIGQIFKNIDALTDKIQN